MESEITDLSPLLPLRRRTVLHVRTAVGAGGGADKTTLKSPFYLRGTAYRSAAVYFRGAGDLAFAELRARAKEWRCPLFEISDRGALDLAVVPKLYVLCRRLGVEVLHAHEYKSNIAALLVGRMLGLKLVSTVHGWVEHSPRLNLYYKADGLALRRFDRVVAVSADLFELCSSKGIEGRRLRLIHNAIEAERYRRSMAPCEARKRRQGSSQKEPSRPIVIGAVSRLSEEKGLPFLLQAFAKLCAAGHDVELWIAGEGRQRPALEAQAASSGAGDRVVFLGHVRDPIALFECLDLYCLPSLREGLPNTLLEALAMEVAVVATAVGGIPAVLDDGRDCRLVPPGSSQALEKALADLVSDREQRARLAQAGRRLIERQFGFRQRMQKMVAIYDELFAEDHVRAG